MEAPRPGQVGHGQPSIVEIYSLSTREDVREKCEDEQEGKSQAHIDALMISHRQNRQQRESAEDQRPCFRLAGELQQYWLNGTFMMDVLDFTGEVQS